MKNTDVGILLNENAIKIQRQYFKQMCQLIGLRVKYRAPIESAKNYNLYGELDSHFEPAIEVGCIYDEHPSQKTMAKLGWNAELAETSVVVHVPYDLKGLQAGALFFLPSGLDNAPDRMFKVLRMTNIAIYPCSIACELGPVYTDDDEQSTVSDFTKTNFNMLDDESEDYNH